MIVPWLVMGGADRFNLNLVQQLSARGWQVSIATTEKSDDPWHDEFARCSAEIFLLHRMLEFNKYPEFLKELILSRRPEIVFISNSEMGYLLLPYLRAFCPEPVYLDYCHSEELHWRDGGYPALSVQQREYLDATLVASAHLKGWMEGRGGAADRIFVRHINVDTGCWRPDPVARGRVRKLYGISGEAPVILYPARLTPEKQPLLFAETIRTLASRHPSLVAVVAGDGELKGELVRFVERHGFEKRVLFLGSVPVAEMPALAAACDILFLPSLYEGISLAVYEAMACALAVVTADVGGQRELVREGAGVLVCGTAESAAGGYLQALERLIADPAARKGMGAAARELVEGEFSLSRMADGFEALCLAAASNRRRSLPLDPCAATRSAQRGLAYLRALGRDAAAPGSTGLPVSVRLYALIARLLNPLYFWCVGRRWRWVIALKNRVRKGMGVDG
jgi:glycosyltransferase involved in cell wall biosynthesis